MNGVGLLDLYSGLGEEEVRGETLAGEGRGDRDGPSPAGRPGGDTAPASLANFEYSCPIVDVRPAPEDRRSDMAGRGGVSVL